MAGRALPQHDQVLVVITDSVMQQLDALKSDGNVGFAVRRFFRDVLEECGPAGALAAMGMRCSAGVILVYVCSGLDFLTVLGAHEGEGLLLEEGLDVAGSRTITDKGHKVRVDC